METYAELQTEKASQYIASLCQHFGRKVPVQNDGTTGQIQFPFGRCALWTDRGMLKLTIFADSQTDLEKAAEVVASHLERFAFRENPEINWRPVQDTPAIR